MKGIDKKHIEKARLIAKAGKYAYYGAGVKKAAEKYGVEEWQVKRAVASMDRGY